MAIRSLSAALVAASMLASCAALKKPDAPITMRLSPSFAEASLPLLPGSVSVAPVQARGVTAALRYAYVDTAAPGEIRQAATLFWEESPANVLERAIVSGLRQNFASVSGSDVALAADQRVVTRLQRFEEVSQVAQTRAVVAFDASVLKGGKIVRSGSYCAAAPIADAAPTTRAHAFDTAIVGAVQAMADDMRRSRSDPAPSC